MKCLSLKQPYAELVVSGRKTIELRTWNTRFRGAFVVHASGNVDREACLAHGISPHSVVRRAAVGKAFLHEVKEYASAKELAEDSCGHLATGRYAYEYPVYGFVLKDAAMFAKPVYMPGRLGFFEANITVPW